MTGESPLSPSLEDYLEAILELEKRRGSARVKDIAQMLRVQMPSVTGALKVLQTRNLVEHRKNSFIRLTEAGLQAASSVRLRHSTLQAFLEQVLLIDPDTAEDQACRMEHSVQPETARRLQNCLEYLLDEVFSKKLVSPAAWARRIKKG
jgi:DtxR family Mn-dependent transcriptional regulator